MPLMLWLLGTCAALAQGTALWLAEPMQPERTDLLEDRPVSELLERSEWKAADADALAHLEAELEAVRPLVDAFDGELRILTRLEAALDEVEVVRTDLERDLVRRALLFQGFAVQRYYQDSLATDPGAAHWRTTVQGVVEVRPWVDAVALDPEQAATETDIPQTPERRAFDATRARLLVAPPGTVQIDVHDLGTQVYVDARHVQRSEGAVTARLPPGLHRIAWWRDAQVIGRARVRVGADLQYQLTRSPTVEEWHELARVLSEAPTTALPAPIAKVVSEIEGAHLALPGPLGPRVFRIEDGYAVLLLRPETEGPIAVIDADASLASPAADLSAESIQVQAVIDAPVAEVWRLWTTSEGVSAWLAPARVELRIGGPFEVHFAPDAPKGQRGSEGCKILSFVPERMLSLTWNAPPTLTTRTQHTWVVVDLQPKGRAKTLVTLTHTGWPTTGLHDPGNDWSKTWAYFEAAWPKVLGALAAFADSP